MILVLDDRIQLLTPVTCTAYRHEDLPEGGIESVCMANAGIEPIPALLRPSVVCGGLRQETVEVGEDQCVDLVASCRAGREGRRGPLLGRSPPEIGSSGSGRPAKPFASAIARLPST